MRLKKLCALLLAVVLTLGLCSCSIGKKGKYEKAVDAVRNGRYQEAIESLEALDGYEDSAEYITYARALQAGDSGDYETAIKALEALNGFEKSAVYITSYTTLAYEAEQARMKNVYNQAIADVKSGNYDAAIAAFETLNDYEDSGKYIMYARCLKTGDSGDYDTAIKSLTSMGDFKEAAMYIKYYTALVYEADESYEKAAAVYDEILLFKDVQTRVAALPDKILDRDLERAIFWFGTEDHRYLSELEDLLRKKYSTSDTLMYEKVMAYASQWREQKNYEPAVEAYALLVGRGYRKAESALQETAYDYANALMSNGQYADASNVINERISGYKDSAELLNECSYQLALETEAGGAQNAQAAYDAFKALGAYKDSAKHDAAYETKYNDAVSKEKAGEFDAAIALFTELGTFSNSSEWITETQNAKAYAAAASLMASEKYEEAIEAFKALNGYSDSVTKISECNTAILEREYQKALKLMNEEKYEESIKAFRALNGYSDSATKISECKTAILEREYRKALKLMTEEKYEESIKTFEALNGYSDSTTKISECKTAILEREYQKATRLMEDEKYEEAITTFYALKNYKDSATQILECDYRKAVNLMNDKKFDEATELFSKLNGYSNSTTQIVECTYREAGELCKSGKYDEAYAIYLTIPEYKNVSEILKTDKNLLRVKFKAGNSITLGNYPQTTAGNDNTPIEWLVLENDGETALLISRYALDSKTYHNTMRGKITWEQCALRNWLNNEFYNRAFSTEEKQCILQSDVSADKNPKNSTNPGNATKDNVFLLSIVEANKYFKSDDARKCAPTDYAIQQGAYASDSYKVEGRRACWWWLRSPGYYSNIAALVLTDGSINYGSVDLSSDAVRPCVRVRLF